ncbi:MAG: SDR family NAD(P)-dependent oxidoreductase [Candidatus Sericytochromatia bacterium]
MLKPLLMGLDHLLDQTVIGGYDRLGYWLRKPLWDPADTQVDLQGSTCLVTGANSGLGLATAQALAARGARVILACRNPERGERALAQIQRETGNTRCVLEIVDMGDMASVRALAERINSRYPRLDRLILNAGALLNTQQTTSEGLDASLAINLLGPYLLTTLLMPLLKTSAPARVILVASGGMYFASLHSDDLEFRRRPYNGALAYAEAKRGLVVLNRLWAHELAGSGVLVNAMHPGWADTPGVQDALPLFRTLTRLTLRNQEEGADTIVWLALCPHLHQSGEFWCDRRPRAVHRLDSTRNAPSEIESWWHRLGQLTDCPRPFPYTSTPSRSSD